MTPEELNAIRDRCDKASPGPWFWADQRYEKQDDGDWLYVNHPINWERRGYDSEWVLANGPVDSEVVKACAGREGEAFINVRREDAEFIASARQDIPALLAEIDRMNDLLKPTGYTCECPVCGTDHDIDATTFELLKDVDGEFVSYDD